MMSLLPMLGGLLLLEALVLLQARRAGRRTPLVALFCLVLALVVVAGLLWPVLAAGQSASLLPIPLLAGAVAMLAAGGLGLAGQAMARDACWYILLGIVLLTVVTIGSLLVQR